MRSKFAAVSLALTLATFAVSSVAEAAPLPKVFHLHPNTSDSRVHFVVFNRAVRAYDVRIGDHVYSVKPHYVLNITAPTGTGVYAATDMATYKNGELLQEIKATDKSKILILF
ncbi:hypothetical protein BH10ACI4_BH10ACI4_30820 [soil metagenome]